MALAISLLANALLLREVRVGLAPAGAALQRREVALAPLSAAEWEANRRAPGVRPPRTNGEAPLATKPVPPPPPPPVKGQVVDVAPSKDSRAPQDSRFLSERNNTVEKETRSRHAKAGYPNTAPTPSDPKAARPPPPDAERAAAAGDAGRSGGGAPGDRRGGPRLGEKRPTEPGARREERLALAPSRDGEMRLREPRVGAPGTPAGAEALGAPGGAEGEPTEGPAGKPGPRSSLSLHPSAATYDRLAGGPAPDRLEGVEEGEGTYLNTREFKYASYFNRIKQAVANHWDPGAALQARDPTGERFAYKDRLTLLAVRLDDAGTLKDVTVEKSSGVDFLDRVAMDAFRKAQPFVNPPGGLADGRGEILFSFGFYVELGSGLHIFRGATPRR